MTELNNMIFDLIRADEVVSIDLSTMKAITFTNPYSVEEAAPATCLCNGKVWNTGLASAGCPHVDEQIAAKEAVPAYNVTDALVPDMDDFNLKYKHVASLRLYKNNEYVYLKPGDSITILPKTANEALYYLQMQNTEILKITSEYLPEAVTEEGEDEEAGE